MGVLKNLGMAFGITLGGAGCATNGANPMDESISLRKMACDDGYANAAAEGAIIGGTASKTSPDSVLGGAGVGGLMGVGKKYLQDNFCEDKAKQQQAPAAAPAAPAAPAPGQ